MNKNRKKAFSLIELVIVVTMIWILIMATTIYFWGTDEKRKTIEALWCASTIWWEINNFVFYTLTSKNLRLSNSETVSPEYYILWFSWWTTTYCSSGNMCDKIDFLYSSDLSEIKTYKTLTISSICHWNKQPLKFYWSWWNTDYVIMNKWFAQKSESNKEVFYVRKNNGSKSMVWDIIVWLCLNTDCTNPKQIWKFVADARSQTIALKTCRFYQSEDPTKCKEREK